MGGCAGAEYCGLRHERAPRSATTLLLLSERLGGVIPDLSVVVRKIRWAIFGVDDPRIRATWRFLLAWPLLPLVGAVVALAMPLLGLSGMIPGGPLQGIVLLVMLVPWSRYVDRRPLSDYGVSASGSWVLNLLVGLLATVGVWGAWHALGHWVGWIQVELSVTAPQGSVAFGLGGALVSLAINSWVQDVVFFAIVLASAAEGFRSRGVDSGRAVLGGWLVGILFFTVIHGTPTVLDFVATAVGGALFGLLYVHTGELALTIGVHCGASYAAGTLFAAPARADVAPSVFRVTESLPLDVGGEVRILLYLATYLVLVGWIRVSRGDVGIETGIAEWVGRE